MCLNAGNEDEQANGVSPTIQLAIRHVRAVGMDFARFVGLIHRYAQRCPGLVDTHLFFRVSDVLIQSGLAASFLLAEGMRNPSRRESRFLIEAAVKLLYVDQQMPRSSLADRLVFFDRRVAAAGIADELRQVNLPLLPENRTPEFVQRVQRHYGHLSEFVHATHAQIVAHIADQDAGLQIGFDSEDSIREASTNLFDTYEITLVACLHAIGPTLAGDLMVALQDLPWVFHAGPYISMVDASYDYKAERQPELQRLADQREHAIQAGWRDVYDQVEG